MGYIYLVTNKINNKQYIGQSLYEDINDRWNQHKRNKSANMCISRAFLKYGIDKFKFQIICLRIFYNILSRLYSVIRFFIHL